MRTCNPAIARASQANNDGNRLFCSVFLSGTQENGKGWDAVRASTGVHEAATVAYAPTFAVLPDFLISRFPDSIRIRTPCGSAPANRFLALVFSLLVTSNGGRL